MPGTTSDWVHIHFAFHTNPISLPEVGRQSGSQRVLINSKIFPEMLLEELSEKRLKISAHTGDSDVPPQLFLVQASPASISQLQCLLRIHIEDSQVSKFQSALGCRKRRLSDGWEDLGGQVPLLVRKAHYGSLSTGQVVARKWTKAPRRGHQKIRAGKAAAVGG
jgi:hypothetical protein